MTDHEARAREIAKRYFAENQFPSAFNDLISAIAKALSEAREEALVVVYSKDERISELEATVAKAFLALGEVAEVLEPFAKIEYSRLYPDGEGWYSVFLGECPKEQADFVGADLQRAKAFRKKVMDLCHASPVPGCETSSAEGPHHSTDGEAR